MVVRRTSNVHNEMGVVFLAVTVRKYSTIINGNGTLSHEAMKKRLRLTKTRYYKGDLAAEIYVGKASVRQHSDPTRGGSPSAREKRNVFPERNNMHEPR